MAITLAALKRRNGDGQLVADDMYRSALDGLARQGDIVPVLHDLADVLAVTYQPVIDARGTVDDVAALLCTSVGTPAEAAPPAA